MTNPDNKNKFVELGKRLAALNKLVLANNISANVFHKEIAAVESLAGNAANKLTLLVKSNYDKMYNQ